MQAQNECNKCVSALKASTPTTNRSNLPAPKQGPSPSTVAAHSTPHIDLQGHIERPEDAKDDLDLILLHEDFPKLLSLAVRVKDGRELIYLKSGHHSKDFPRKRLANSSLQPDEVLQSVLRFQEQLLANPSCKHTIKRGTFVLTDSIIDDSLRILESELELCSQIMDAQSVRFDPTEQAQPTKSKKRGRSKEAIAIKYSKWQTDILMKWMIEHKEDPFPDQADVEYLMDQTGLSQSQVVNWTTNVRKRNRKATCEGGKKPHHFIDFLFLAQDRAKRQRMSTVSQQQYRMDLATNVQPQAGRFAMRSSVSATLPPQLPQFPPPADYRYHHQPAYAAHAESPIQVSRSIFDEKIDPALDMPGDCALEDDPEMAKDFFNTWFETEFPEIGTLDELEHLEAATIDDFVVETRPASVAQPLMPSVTDDSNESQEHRIEGNMSFDLEDDIMKGWAAEVGLTGGW